MSDGTAADGRRRGRTRLIYVVGAARSGTTILDAVLGGQPGIAATGELCQLLRDDHGEPRRCACSRRLEECSLWGPILRGWGEQLDPETWSDYLRLQGRFERLRSVPITLLHATRRSAALRTYARWTRALLEEIAERSQAEVVVDSSKHLSRLLALILAQGIEPGIIHAVRDPRAVVWSKVKAPVLPRTTFRKPSPFEMALRTGLDWNLVNLTAQALTSAYPGVPHARVRYEDLVRVPQKTLARVGSALGVDLTSAGRRAAQGQPFDFGHIMAGNRTRLRGAQRLTLDTDWQASSPPWLRSLTWLLCGALARHYGYQR